MWPASLWACGVPLDRPGTAAGHSGQDPEWFRTPRIGANDDHGALERQEIIRRGRGASTHQRPGPSGSAPHRLHTPPAQHNHRSPTPPARHPHQLSSLGGSAGHRLDAPTANELAGYTEPQVGPDMSNPDETVRLPHTRQTTRSGRREGRPGAPMVTSGYANLSTGLSRAVPTGSGPHRRFAPRMVRPLGGPWRFHPPRGGGRPLSYPRCGGRARSDTRRCRPACGRVPPRAAPRTSRRASRPGCRPHRAP